MLTCFPGFVVTCFGFVLECGESKARFGGLWLERQGAQIRLEESKRAI